MCGQSRRLIAVTGPTASGKSSLALKLAVELAGEIVNCDSMQMVRGMDVGTAKPSPEEQKVVPHHLFDRVDPDGYFSAGKYMEEARATCEEIASRGRVPIVVGGTGLYLRALLEGIFQGPGRSDRIRRRLERISSSRGRDCLHRLLSRRDPATAAKTSAADEIRVIRALEVYYQTGEPISQLHGGREPFSGFEVRKLGIEIPREDLYGRINARVKEMFRTGLVEEVERLLAEGFKPDCKGFEAIGYRQVIAFLEGQLTIEEAIELVAMETRRYAKRQMTWFRKEQGINWIRHPGESFEAFERALEMLGQAG